jgi:hypothetical protein
MSDLSRENGSFSCFFDREFVESDSGNRVPMFTIPLVLSIVFCSGRFTYPTGNVSGFDSLFRLGETDRVLLLESPHLIAGRQMIFYRKLGSHIFVIGCI